MGVGSCGVWEAGLTRAWAAMESVRKNIFVHLLHLWLLQISFILFYLVSCHC